MLTTLGGIKNAYKGGMFTGKKDNMTVKDITSLCNNLHRHSEILQRICEQTQFENDEAYDIIYNASELMAEARITILSLVDNVNVI